MGVFIRHMLRVALLDGFTGRVCEHRRLVITDSVHLFRRYQYLFTGKPVPDFDDQLADRPRPSVHHEIANVTDRLIAHP